MEVRYIKPEEAVDFQKVSAASFIWEFDPKEDNSVNIPVLAAFNEGKLVAGAEMYDFRTNYCGNILDAIIVEGVCSQPECRRMGAVRKIFEKVSELAVDNDWTLGFLHPFSIAYYAKFGYANLSNLLTIKISFDKLKHIAHNTDVELYTGEQFEILSSLHTKCALKENLMTLREDKKHFCATPIESADYTYIHKDKSGEADGYVRFKVDRPDCVIVQDLYVLTPEALYALIGFLRSYDGIAKNLVVCNQYQASPFASLTRQLDGVAYENMESLAVRIYNLQKVLESNAYPEDYGKFSLKCCDDIERNNAIFDVEYQNGKATVSKRTEGDYDISVTAPAAARLLLVGEGHTAETAVYIDGVELKTSADDFFKAFPHRHTHFTYKVWS